MVVNVVTLLVLIALTLEAGTIRNDLAAIRKMQEARRERH